MVAGDNAVGEDVLTLVGLRIIATRAVTGFTPSSRIRRATSSHAGALAADAERRDLDAFGAIMTCRSRRGEEALLRTARCRA